ncbi:MAG: TldD/PmbA family protein [Theionarchaea archaeon]|nr:TldD/PmbA family protein [Theionarchaea archaeon]MBU7020071.1 TldD/PmbA family protein [Theionarchaea archaeon]MBU7034288.1 TldD/PmbA family protein [Theionarchaea archaeon]MBU7039514.1 TldD/PmbA family protein [Theionarchaea archaeon]
MIENTRYAVKKALELGATEVIVKGVDSCNQQVRFSNNEIDIAKTWFETVLNIFLVYERRVVLTEIRNVEIIDETLKQAVKLARISKENPEYGGIAEGPFKYPDIESDPGLRGITDHADYIMAAINTATEHADTTFGALQVVNERVALSTSQNVEVQDEKTSIELSIRAFSQKEASGHSVTCSSTLKGFDPEKAGKEAGEFARLARDPVQGEEGTYDVILSPLFVGSILNYSVDMTSAFNVLAGRSMYGGKIGEKVASDAVTVIDTPRGLATMRTDDEGVPTTDTHVIEKGVMKTYLHNTSTARAMNTETTANAGLVKPEPLNIWMLPGDYSTEELFQNVKNGLYLTNTWYTRFQNVQTGDFSTIPRDAILVIKNGEIVGSTKNIRVSDNMLQLYLNIEAVAKEQKVVHWWAEVGFPCISSHVLARNVHITRSTE